MTAVGAGWNITSLEEHDLNNTYFAHMCECLTQAVAFVTQQR